MSVVFLCIYLKKIKETLLVVSLLLKTYLMIVMKMKYSNVYFGCFTIVRPGYCNEVKYMESLSRVLFFVYFFYKHLFCLLIHHVHKTAFGNLVDQCIETIRITI